MWSESLTIYDPVQDIIDRLNAEEEKTESEEGMERLNKHDISEIKKVFNSYNDETLSALAVTLSKLGLDCIDTIEAQQQEIKLLNMEIAELRESNQALKDYAENADADKDEQAGRIMRMEELLKAARSRLPNIGRLCVCGTCKTCGVQIGYASHRYCDNCLGQAIDALLGGKEDA